ncbi:GspH/FimT family pseudopilin [Marinobacter sp. SS13-12]|uniref:GspH/FimT family pseudopilin n=1 Tax=Marinobacter sp. SS13-12 TaxID=3050451 RepID=UPI0033079568
MVTRKKTSGFTLIELMITVALVGVIAAFAVPSFANLIANSRLASASNDVVGVLNYARSQAVKEGRRVIVSATDGANWANGISVWIDRNGNGSMQDAEELRRTSAAGGAVTISSSSNFMFTGGGLLPNGSGAVTMQICDDRNGESGSSITVTLGGRIRSEDLTCG